MIDAEPPVSLSPRVWPRFQLRIWHLALLVVFVAVAIVQIQDQRPGEPGLVAIACAGFVLYGVLGVARLASSRDRPRKDGSAQLAAAGLLPDRDGRPLPAGNLDLPMDRIYLYNP